MIVKSHKSLFAGVVRIMSIRLLLSICIVIGIQSVLKSQSGGFYPEADTVPEIDIDYVPTVKPRIFAGRPGKAALYSLILPGAGQAYNKKYWQVPIVWAGVGTVGYFVGFNSKEYKKYRDAYHERIRARIAMEPPVETEEFAGATDDQIRNVRDQWNRYRQMTIFGFALAWIANSAQAYVGAHLKDFDVSDDLSIEFVPFSETPGSVSGFESPTLISSSIIVRF